MKSRPLLRGTATEFSSLKPGEILTRIRLPLEEIGFQVYRKVGKTGSPAVVSFAAAAGMTKGNLETVRFAMNGLKGAAFCIPELETRLAGLKLPIPGKEIEAQTAGLGKSLEQVPSYRRHTAMRLLRWFLQSLNQRSLEIP